MTRTRDPVRALNVLIVDDKNDVRESMRMLLEMMGYEIYLASSGVEGVEQAGAVRPDVVLLDIGLPDIDGWDVARKIRQEPWGEEMVLVAVTGWGQDSDKQRSVEAGFDHHVVKPMDPDSLLERLASVEQSLSVS